MYLVYKDETNVLNAEYIMFYRTDTQKFLIPIIRRKCRISPNKMARHLLFFRYEGQLFYYSSEKIFKPSKEQIIMGLLKNEISYEDLMMGLDVQQVEDLQSFYGSNKIDVEMTPFYLKFIQEFFSPINFSQVILVMLFVMIRRIFYSIVVFFYVIITVFLKSYEYYSNRKKLQYIS